MKKIKFLILAVLGTALASGAKAGIIEVESGGDIRAALRKASAADTVLLKAGEYTLPSQIEQTKDIVLMGESGKMPVVNFTNFVLGTGADKLVLDGIHIIYNRKYLVYNANEKDVEIGLIAVRNCIVNLNGENGASLILNRSTGAKNRIGRIEIDNSIVYNGQAPSHGVVNVGKESTAQIGSIRLTNSTFADFVRGVIIVSTRMNDLKIRVNACTFYNVNTSENSAGVFHANLGNTEIEVVRSIFCIPGSSPKFIDAGAGSIVKITDSYRVNMQPRIRNPYGLLTTRGNERSVFASPANDPLDGCTSYRIVDGALSGKKLGDPRWE